VNTYAVVFMDYLTKWPEVVFMDYLTKWPEVYATKDQTSLIISELQVKSIISRHGVPVELFSDRGTAFLSKIMK